ncbi:MAG: hypothetical protein HYX59_07690 [Elusimicrobia bacterium]|nr:hypothetical protein [Elusimicrobiota bacterium]
MRKPLLPLGLLLFPLLAACQRSPETPVPETLTAEERDRRDLLRQPNPEWKPGPEKRKLNILLLIDKTKIRKGDAFAYRLETQNAGQEPLSFKEAAPSFIKEGSLCGGSGFKVLVTAPGAKERPAACLRQTAAVAVSTAPGREPETGLDVTLQSGDYLLTRGSGPVRGFRPLLTATAFDALGTYKLKAEYAAKDGFKAVSNTVTLEVVP